MELHTLWVGRRLGWFERLCLASMLAHGHRVILWCYQSIENVPQGVLLAPAGSVLPESAVIRHRVTNSLALFSDRFRYRLLRMQDVTWVDVDVLFLRELRDQSPMLFALEDPTSVGNAVLRLPSEHLALREIEYFALQDVPVPFWWSRWRRWRQHLSGLVGRHVSAEEMPWGTFGPEALTEALRRHGLLHLARPREVFYPIHWSEARLIFGPSDKIERSITSETIAVHLWGDSNQRERREQPPPHGSWIASMCERFSIAPDLFRTTE
jgi:hypothetical protein